jgi:colanic acid/amylovoran biosynthesis protein
MESKRKARILINHLILKLNYNLTFISTCQGVRGYVDDSLFANEIVNKLSVNCQEKCKIINQKFSLENLVKELSNYDAYIGMRLHGAILSMIGGLPALNIAYEDKTIGIYESMELEEHCFRYSEDVDLWLSKTIFF